MKTTFLVITLIGCIALGILSAEQSKELKTQRGDLAQAKQELAALQAELKEKEEAIENAKLSEAKTKILQQTVAESTTVAVAESKKSEKLKASLDEAQTNNPMQAIAKMFKDPKMREMMKAQQKAFIGPAIEKQYGDLFKQLKMTPEQVADFKDIVGKKMLGSSDLGMSMLDDSLDSAQRADMAKQVKDQNDEFENQLKQAVGDENYKAYQSFEKSIPDRTTVGQFNDQFGDSSTALSGAQQEQLVQALSEARNNFNWASGLNQQNLGANGDIGSMFTKENIEKYAAEREQFDQQFLVRAQQILTPEQFAAYKQFQITQREMQILSMKMAGGMLNSGSR
jgi:hypothetical protein